MSALQSPNTFAQAWGRKFRENVEAAAGRDGRLSLREALRIGERTDGNRLWSDNAVHYLRFTGHKSVSVAKLLAEADVYVRSHAARAAGPDGRLSAADGARLPADLRDDFIYLRTSQEDRLLTPAEQRPGARDMALRSLDNGTAVKLATAPDVVRGLRPLEEHVPHRASDTTISTWVTPSGEVYFSRAASRPTPLVGWYHAGTFGAEARERGQLRADVESVTKDLLLTSESDSRLELVLAEAIDSEPIDEHLIRGRLGYAHDVLAPALRGAPQSTFAKLAARQAQPAQDGEAYLQKLVANADPNDPQSVAAAQKFAQLWTVLRKYVTGLQLFRFADGADISVFLVGRTRSGDLAGVLASVVET